MSRYGLRPLPEAQQGIWFAQALDPADPAFNTAEYHDMRGPLDVAAFVAAASTAMAEADGLAVRVTAGADGPMVEPWPDHRPRIESVDVSGAADPAAEARRLMQQDLEHPIDPARDPMARGILFRIGEDRHWWYQRIHHLVVDGYGTVLINDRIVELYNAAISEERHSGPPLDGYAQALAADEEYRAGERRRADRQFWLESGDEGAPPLPLVEAGSTSGIPHRATVVWKGSGAVEFVTLARRIGAGWPDLMTVLVAEFLRRRSGEREIVIGLPTMLRMGTGVARVATMAMNVLPFRFAPDQQQPIADLMSTLTGSLRAVRRHGRYRSEQLRRDRGWSGGGRRLYGPLVNVLPFGGQQQLVGMTVDRHLLNAGPVDDLTVTVRGGIDGSSISIEIEADQRLYGSEDADSIAAMLVSFLDRAVLAETLAEVPTLDPGEAHRWVEEVNATARRIPETTLPALLTRTIERHGNEIALIDCDGSRLTWQQVGERAEALARSLAAIGVERGDPVVVALPRSADLVIAIYAVILAGGAWMPIDPEQPVSRIAAMIDGAGAAVAVTTDSWRERLEGRVKMVSVADLARIEGVEHVGPLPESPAYLIHTSGSTGNPKGVQVRHQAIVNRLLWMEDELGVGCSDILLLKTPATFDVSVWELWLPAVTGATLVVSPPESHRDPAAIAALIREQAVTLVHFVPSMLDAFLAEPAAAGIATPRVVVSGEALTASLRDRFHRTCSGELINLYGPTEAAVDVTIWRADRNDRSDPVPIGRPVWNTRAYVLDELLRPVAPGTPGDLWLAGVQLADGYRGDPERTAAAFVADPFGAAGDRMYRTGDRATWRSDGELIYLGRDDGQIKLRGQRIETGEIVAALLRVPGIAHAAVILREDRQGDQRLVAYLVPRAGSPEPDIVELRSLLAESLPANLIPAAFVFPGEMPLTSHGKLDHARLPVPSAAVGAGAVELDGTEAVVAECFTAILGLGTDSVISRETDFFAAGGHSLLAVRLARMLSEKTGISVGLGAIFAHPTVARLAAHLPTQSAAAPEQADWEGLGPVITLSDGPGIGAAPPLFCIHPAGGISWSYREFGAALGDLRPVVGLQSRGIHPDDSMPDSLIELAENYCSTIRAIQPDGPYYLLGWSVGGLIAHEIAVSLEEAGERVATLAMLDSFPADRWRGAVDPDEAESLRALALVAGYAPDEVGDGQLRSRGEVVAFLREREHPLGSLSDAALDGIFRTVLHNNRLVRNHRHRSCRCNVTWFSAALDHSDDGHSSDEWRQYIEGDLLIHPIESRHPHMVRAAQVARITELLRAEWLVEQQ